MGLRIEADKITTLVVPMDVFHEQARLLCASQNDATWERMGAGRVKYYRQLADMLLALGIKGVHLSDAPSASGGSDDTSNICKTPQGRTEAP